MIIPDLAFHFPSKASLKSSPDHLALGHKKADEKRSFWDPQS